VGSFKKAASGRDESQRNTGRGTGKTLRGKLPKKSLRPGKKSWKTEKKNICKWTWRRVFSFCDVDVQFRSPLPSQTTWRLGTMIDYAKREGVANRASPLRIAEME